MLYYLETLNDILKYINISVLRDVHSEIYVPELRTKNFFGKDLKSS